MSKELEEAFDPEAFLDEVDNMISFFTISQASAEAVAQKMNIETDELEVCIAFSAQGRSFDEYLDDIRLEFLMYVSDGSPRSNHIRDSGFRDFESYEQAFKRRFDTHLSPKDYITWSGNSFHTSSVIKPDL